MEVAELESGASKSSLSDNSKEEVIQKVESATGNEVDKIDTNHEPEHIEDVASKSIEIEDCSDNSHDEEISETKIELKVENAIADQINKITIENEKNIGELSVPAAKIDEIDSKEDTTNVTSIVNIPNTNSGPNDDSPPIKTRNVEENPNPIQTETSVTENSDIVLNKKATRDVENSTEITQPIKLSSQNSKTDFEEHSIGMPSRDCTEIKSEAQQKERQEIISDIDRVIELEDVQTQQQNKSFQAHQHQQKQDQHDVFDASSLVQQIQDQNNVSHIQSPFTVQQGPNIKTLLAPQPTIASKSVTSEESRSDTGYVRKNECYEVEENDGFRMARSTKTIVQENRNPMFMTQKEQRSMSLPSWKNNITQESSSAISKKIDLQKIFTPATDAEEILPKNRKLYASSAFYSSNLHPTVEDQVALARRISHSLSDISNHQSKGQSMYVNRKKRSVKWVHEGSGQGQPEIQEYNEESKENEYDSKKHYNEKVPLKLVMNPHGQVRDLSSVCEPLSETGLLSPDRCAELVIALNATKGRGAELFAKRRRKAEKWIVDENNAGTVSQSGPIDPYQQSYKPTSPASMVPAYSDVGIHRVQLNMQQDKIQDKYSQPNLKIIKSPWEAALQTGSASNAFEEVNKHSGQHLPYGQYPNVPRSFTLTPLQEQVSTIPHQKISTYSSQRDLAYKPNIPQGWKAPAVVLPKELYVPKEIPLESYAPPPEASHYFPNSGFPVNQHASAFSAPAGNGLYSSFPTTKLSTDSYNQSQSSQLFSRIQPQKQQQLYQQQQTSPGHSTPVNFSPSPLAYDKLAKFQRTDPTESTYQTPYLRQPNATPTSNFSDHIKTQQKSFSKPEEPSLNWTQRLPSQEVKNYSFGSTSIPQNSTYSMVSTPSVDLLHCQNFNVSARGWTGARKHEPYRPLTVTPKPVGGNLRYTDF